MVSDEGGARSGGGADDRARVRAEIRGAVQGVGFRPAMHRLATSLGLAGWVINGTQGVVLEVEGPRERVDRFVAGLAAATPPLARVHRCVVTALEPRGETRFEIRASDDAGERSVVVLPDAATCDDCLAEVLDPRERRHGYPFTNCTNCGPRFTIVRGLPYDRPLTTMAGFPMCARCRAEYDDPADRRFHAQPVACPDCGPRLALWAADGAEVARDGDALRRAADALAGGAIVAVKGLGGFHLMCRADAEETVSRLRERKRRVEKPFALMVRDLDAARGLVRTDAAAEGALASVAAPIVLLPRLPSSCCPGSPAPRSRRAWHRDSPRSA